MKGISRTLIAIMAIVMVVQPALAWAGPGARVIPQGKVSLLVDGKEVNQFQSEMPLPEGTLMLCSGRCLVQTQNIQLVAQDQAVFALAEGQARWDLTVKSGQLDFALRTGSKPVSFHTPHDTIQAERAIVPASSTAMVRGSLTVTESESVMSIQEGALQVMSPDGTQLVEPGQSIRLAQSQVAPPQKKDDDKKKAGAVVVGTGAAGIGTAALIGAGVGVAAIGVVGGLVATDAVNNNKETTRAASPF
jgi:hypothetical protein